MGSSGGGGQSGSQSRSFSGYASSRGSSTGGSGGSGGRGGSGGSGKGAPSRPTGGPLASEPPAGTGAGSGPNRTAGGEAGGGTGQSTPGGGGGGGGVYGGLHHFDPLTPIYGPGPGGPPDGPVISGCPGIGSDWQRGPRTEVIAAIRPLLGVITRDLEDLLASGAVRRAYEMVFRFLAEAGTLRHLDSLVRDAGSATGRPEWHLDLVDWMKESVEAAVREGEAPEHLEWAKDLLEHGLAQLLPGGDLYDPQAPDPDAVHQHCLKAAPDAVAKCFFCRAMLHLLRYHLSHVAARLPDLSPAAVEDLAAACAEMARRAYGLRPATVAPGQWFAHIQQNPRLYVEDFLKIRRLQEAA